MELSGRITNQFLYYLQINSWGKKYKRHIKQFKQTAKMDSNTVHISSIICIDSKKKHLFQYVFSSINTHSTAPLIPKQPWKISIKLLRTKKQCTHAAEIIINLTWWKKWRIGFLLLLIYYQNNTVIEHLLLKFPLAFLSSLQHQEI